MPPETPPFLPGQEPKGGPGRRGGGPPWAHRGGPFGPHGDSGRPPWWPADLDWPPQEDDWERHRARLFRRAALPFFLFAIVACVFGWSLAFLVSGFRSGDFDGGPPAHVMIILIVLVTAGVTALIKMAHFRRGLVSVVDLMEAADHIAGGDFSARIEPRGVGEIQRLSASFNEMAERLELNEEQRRRLLADIAHELRTPLAVIQGTIEGVIDGVYPPDTASLEPLLSEVAVMTRLLEDLQLLAHAEAGELRLHREPTDLPSLITDLAAALQPQARQRGITLLAETAPLPELLLDPIRIRQVLENLLSNALRYTPGEGKIVIAVWPEPAQAVVEVRDTGRGMTEQERALMFARFVKSADSGGSGLGLAIAHGLVEAHGGTIHADAAPDGGTIVRFTLPLAP